MFQHTMDRAVDVFDSYKTLYKGYEDELSLGQRFVAEYSVMKNEILDNSNDFYIENIIDGESGSTDASVGKIGENFRKIYEKPKKASGPDIGVVGKDPHKTAEVYTQKISQIFKK